MEKDTSWPFDAELRCFLVVEKWPANNLCRRLKGGDGGDEKGGAEFKVLGNYSSLLRNQRIWYAV